MRVLYDLTYATRGISGIPKDARDVARLLMLNENIDTDFFLSPNTYVKRRWARLMFQGEDLVGSSLRSEVSRLALPNRLTNWLIVLQSISLIRRIKLIKVKADLAKRVFDWLNLSNYKSDAREFSLHILNISYLARFARPKFLKPYKIKSTGYDFVIQQQLDPLDISNRTLHIIRLHDILPITHPYHFEPLAFKGFEKSLRIALEKSNLIFVMDTESSANEFKGKFGQQLDVRVIPCVVEVANPKVQTQLPRENQICIVNTIEPRKRVLLAIEGFKFGKAQGIIPQDWKLYIVGKKGWMQDELMEKLQKKSFGNDVIYEGGLTDTQVATLYQTSKIVLSTSVAEGFGLPPLEGMSHGCLPVVSDLPQHLETIGQKGFYFHENSAVSVATALGEAISILSQDPENLANELRNHIRERFSQRVVSEKWLELLRGLKR